MDNEFVLLTQKEEMWARMLMDVLQDNDVPCSALPVYGAALALKSGRQEQLRVYVPADYLPQATELLDALFNAEIIDEE